LFSLLHCFLSSSPSSPGIFTPGQELKKQNRIMEVYEFEDMGPMTVTVSSGVWIPPIRHP
jgi:hypothetical protein